MKKIFSILVAVILTASVFAQAPQLMSYQAVIRDSNNNLIKNQSIGMRVSILENYTKGNIIYQEIYNPNPLTNTNGLVSIKIGSGLPTIGTFSSINWSIGINIGAFYTIKTEIDPTGGTNYTITGTSQLISVPYALYANKADSANFSKYAGKADSVKYSTPTPITTTNNIKISGAGTIANPYIIYDSVHKIGDSYGGGIVFYVYDSGRHGLIAAPTDQAIGIRWYAGTYTNTKAFFNGIGAGKINTPIIIANQSVGDGATYAASLYEYFDFSSIGDLIYGDWYLPSEYELSLMYVEIGPGAASPNTNIGGFASSNYWSSTESDYTKADYLSFSNGTNFIADKSSKFYVRAIRSF